MHGASYEDEMNIRTASKRVLKEDPFNRRAVNTDSWDSLTYTRTTNKKEKTRSESLNITQGSRCS